MARVKVCPRCGRRNPPSSSICLSDECSWDLTGIRAENLREESPVPAPETGASPDSGGQKPEPAVSRNSGPEVSPAPEPRPAPGSSLAPEIPPGKIYVRICPGCGTENRAVAKVCTACRQDIRMVPKTLADRKTGTGTADSPRPAVPENTLIAVLKSPDGTELLRIDSDHPVHVIGREHTLMEYLAGRDYTSRRHAELVVSGKRLVIRDFGKPNGTFINNVRMAAESAETLKDGDRVSLGGIWEEDWKSSLAGCFTVSYPGRS